MVLDCGSRAQEKQNASTVAVNALLRSVRDPCHCYNIQNPASPTQLSLTITGLQQLGRILTLPGL